MKEEVEIISAIEEIKAEMNRLHKQLQGKLLLEEKSAIFIKMIICEAEMNELNWVIKE